MDGRAGVTALLMTIEHFIHPLLTLAYHHIPVSPPWLVLVPCAKTITSKACNLPLKTALKCQGKSCELFQYALFVFFSLSPHSVLLCVCLGLCMHGRWVREKESDWSVDPLAGVTKPPLSYPPCDTLCTPPSLPCYAASLEGSFIFVWHANYNPQEPFVSTSYAAGPRRALIQCVARYARRAGLIRKRSLALCYACGCTWWFMQA